MEKQTVLRMIDDEEFYIKCLSTGIVTQLDLATHNVNVVLISSQDRQDRQDRQDTQNRQDNQDR